MNNEIKIKIEELEKAISNELVDTEVESRFGTGKITEIQANHSNLGYGFISKIQFPTETKQLHLNVVVQSGIVKLPEDKKQILEQRTKDFETIGSELKQLEAEEREEEKRKLAAEKAELKWQEHIKKVIENVDRTVHIEVDTKDSDLLWLKEHGGPIKAAMPDYLDYWFMRTFGEFPHKLVDSKKRTTGGYPMQWAFSLSMRVKDYQNAPTGLKQYINDKGQINNTAFLSTLHFNHNFAIC